MTIHVVKVDWAERQNALKEIRFEVFVEEQHVPLEEELDGQDEGSSHFLALNEAGQALGCARLLPSGQIGRMAVRLNGFSENGRTESIRNSCNECI